LESISLARKALQVNIFAEQVVDVSHGDAKLPKVWKRSFVYLFWVLRKRWERCGDIAA
jgi:hypothetical protein